MALVLIVDVSHIAYTHAHSNRQLSAVINGVDVNTTVQTGIIKNIYRWSQGGSIPTVVAFDRACPARKRELELLGSIYKEGRPKSGMIRWALDDTYRLLRSAGVSCVAEEGYEADDLIAAAVSSARDLYPGEHIEIVTGDTDLMSLSAPDVSIYLRSPRGTSSVRPNRSKHRYAEIVPSNYEDILSTRTMFKGLRVPYNTVMLAKLLRGDTSDNIKSPVKSLFRPKAYNALVEDFVAQGLTAENNWKSHDLLFDFLTEYVPPEYLGQLEVLWSIICLNYPYTERPSYEKFSFTGFASSALKDVVKEYKINL